MTASNWAIILCKFHDDTDATLPLAHYQRLFTGAGTGSFNMVDFFRDMSHGQLDLSDSQVFGWFTLSIDKAAYVGNAAAGAGQFDRNGLVGLCRQAAVAGGVPLGSFSGVVIWMNGSVDLFGYIGGMEAFCDSHSLSPSPLGQEMGHGYGLDHARKSGSTADYQDPWDVMSVFASFMEPNTEWGTIGPGLNAWCMRSRGWLDESRVFQSVDNCSTDLIQLRPLHRRDLPGFLAADLGSYLVEYRPQQRWDSAFPRSAVFVHSFSDNHSYVMAGTGGNYDLAAGDVFEVGDPKAIAGTATRVDVVSIDDDSLTATVRLQHCRRVVNWPELVGTVLGGVAFDGAGGIIIGGHFYPIPPRGPETEILQQLVNYLSVTGISDVRLRMQAQRAALGAIAKITAVRAAQLQTLRTPAPRQRV